MTGDARYERWLARFERIEKQGYAMFHYRELWTETGRITREADLPPSAFFTALGDWYAASQAMAVRRQVDRDPRSISLANLLEDIASQPTVMSRDRHISLWIRDGRDDDYWRDQANRNYDRFAVDGGDSVDPDRVREDLAALDAAAEPVRAYVNKSVAHADEVGLPALPSYEQVHASIDTVGELVQKYSSLLKAEAIYQMTPLIQHDWKAPFRQAWLTDGC